MNKIFVLVGDSFIPSKIYLNKDMAVQNLYNGTPNQYILEYITNVRDKSSTRLVNRYVIKNDPTIYRGLTKEALWETEDTDYGLIYNICSRLNQMFEYDEYDDVCKVKWSHEMCKLLKLFISNFPDWFIQNLSELEGFSDWNTIYKFIIKQEV
jgi:hypothetical protein